MSQGPLTVYLNGEYLPLGEARISVMDRGFLFGDGVYEMIPVYGNQVFRLEEHLSRLQNSLDAIDIPNPYGNHKWRSLIERLLAANPVSRHRSIYIEVTRGEGERDHVYNDQISPTVFILCRPVTEKDYSEGVEAITHTDIRWDYCHIKSISLLPAVLLKNLAKRTHGAHEAVLIKNGKVTEGASSNVFIVKDEVVMTPPKDNRLLPGITRDLILELLRNNNFICKETPVTEEELRRADEIWITSSVMEIAPVVVLDGTSINKGVPGAMWYKARDLYESFKKEIMESNQETTG